MKTDAQKIALYDAKTAPTTVGLKVAAQLTYMKQSFAAQTNSLVTSQLLAAACMDTLGTVGPQRGRLHAFSNRLWKIQQAYNGAAATAMAQAEFNRWKTICTPGDLTAIALDVYNLVVA